jgi:formyl-CoA transferase
MTSTLPRRNFDPTLRGPLTGFRIVDMSRLVCGNTITALLADFGADVIKVEGPGGDPLRAWKVKEQSTHWKVLGRNKRSLCLNTRDPRGVDILLKLIDGAQAFVESFRPGTLEKMGLAPDVLWRRNPRLTIVRVSGWGQTGPYKHRPGYGTLVEGMSGLAAMTGFADREPVLPPVPLADSVAGFYGAVATLAALREVEINGGRGQIVDLPLFDPLFAVLGPQAANYKLTGKVKERTGSRSTNAAPRNVYKTKDGKWVSLSASMQVMVDRLFRAIGRPDLVGDPRYSTNALRVEHGPELDAIVGEFVGRMTQAEAVAYFDKAEVTIGPVYDISQIVEDPHVLARESIVEVPDDDMGSVAIPSIVPTLSGTPGGFRYPAPRLGAHNAEVLAEIGISEVAELVAAGVIGSGRAVNEAELDA